MQVSPTIANEKAAAMDSLAKAGAQKAFRDYMDNDASMPGSSSSLLILPCPLPACSSSLPLIEHSTFARLLDKW